MSECADLSKTETDVRPLFSLDFDSFVQLNHGSFGATPRAVMAKYKELLDQVESNTDSFFRFAAEPTLLRNLELIAPYLGPNVDVANLVFVPNATSAINCVMKSLTDWRSTDVIVKTSIIYASFAATLRDVVPRIRPIDDPTSTVKVVNVTLRPPIYDKERDVLQVIRESLHEQLAASFPSGGYRVRLAIIDLLSSFPAIVLPAKDIVGVLREEFKSEIVLVDGAHAIGQLLPAEIDVAALGCDIFVTNLHKWFFSPKTSGVLFAAPWCHDWLLPVLIAQKMPYFEVEEGREAVDRRSQLQKNFFWQGTQSHCQHMCVAEMIATFDHFGGLTAVQQHVKQFIEKQVKPMLQSRLPTLKPMELGPEFEAPMMRMFIVPQEMVERLSEERLTRYKTHGDFISYDFYKRSGVFAIFGFLKDENDEKKEMIIRLSFQIYNCLSDYEKFIDALIKFFD